MPQREAPATMSLDRYAPDAKAWIVGAQSLADARRHAEVSPLHLLADGLERDAGIQQVFRRASVNVVDLAAAVERALSTLAKSDGAAYLSDALLDLMGRAEREAKREQRADVGAEHVLNALTQEIRGPAGELLGAFGIAPGSLKAHFGALRDAPRRDANVASDPRTAYTRDLLREARGSMDPVIGRDVELRRLVTILERRQKSHPLLVGEPGVGKGAVIRALARRIAGGDVPTTLVGSPMAEVDVGSLVAGARLRGDVENRVRSLIQSVAAGKESETILVVRGVEQLFGQGASGSAVGDILRPALVRGEVRLLGTTTPEGMRRLEERDPALLRSMTVLTIEQPTMPQAIEILRGVAGRYESHHDVRISEGAIRAAVTLAKRYVQDRFLPDSAIDLLDEAAAALRVAVDGMPADVDEGARRLESLRAQIASLEGVDDALTVETRQRLEREAEALEPQITGRRSELEARRDAVAKVRALRQELDRQREALEAAKADRDYARVGELEHVTLPDLGARLEAAEQVARSNGMAESVPLDAEHVAQTLAVWTGIPVAKMLEAEADKLTKMESRLEQRVVGQSDAVTALARAVRRGRVGLRDPRKPIGSFLFLGPSGVGKTELAKALAEFLFDDEGALTRLDMSEFMERHMAQRLLGAPPGYADSEQGGFLTEAVRRRPFSVLLFDEVEKAHQDVFNLLLQVLDDGRLTDGRGRLADFTNTVVIMTSNIGSERILEANESLFETDDGREALRDVLIDQLGSFFRPEFLNRIDDVIVFRTLSKGHLRKIVDIQIARVQGLLADRKVTLELDAAAKDALVELGYQPALGARPLRRAIVRHIQDPLAEKMLSGAVAEGATLHVRYQDGQFQFET